MQTFRIEYMTPIGRLKSTLVTAKNFDEAIDAAVEKLGLDFHQIQTLEVKG